jgi:hypothetical protein
MSHESPGLARFIERQMRNWELGRTHGGAPPAEPSQAIQFFIAVSRELGSEGEKVAESVAECLGWPKYDREILNYMSENEEVRRRLYDLMDERERTWMQQMLDLLEPLGPDAALAREGYFGLLKQAVIAIAGKQRAVFVGRGAGFVLPRSRGLSVRIVAPLKDRIKHVMEYESLDERAARRRIEEVESQRAEFLVRHFGHRPYDPRRYDMVLNAGCLCIPDMCSLICLAAERKLGLPLKLAKVLV